MQDSLVIILANMQGKTKDEVEVMSRFLLPKYEMVKSEEDGCVVVCFEAKDRHEWLNRHFSYAKRCPKSCEKACNAFDYLDRFVAQYEYDLLTFEKTQFLDFFCGILKVFSSDNAKYVSDVYKYNFLRRFQ